MANYNKQFNFRNGVQVDNDNLVVSPTGLVGIGTTIPTEALDVRGGNVKVSGFATATSLYSKFLEVNGTAGVTTITFTDAIGAGVSISSGIITAAGTGIVTFYGDARFLTGMPASQWVDIDAGLGYTSIYAQGNVGVGTVDPRFTFQVGGNADNTSVGFTSGVGINSTGDVFITGVTTSNKFVGIGSDLTLLDANNITSGTLSNDRLPILLETKLPSSFTVTGNVNASRFGGEAFTGDDVQAGFITATSGFTGNITGNVTGNVTGDVVGTASTAQSLTGTPDIVVGILTATAVAASSFIGGITGDVTGNLTGTATTATALTSDAVVDIEQIKVGLATVDARIGIGTDFKTGVVEIGGSTSNTADLFINRAYDRTNSGVTTTDTIPATIKLWSDFGESRITIGTSETETGSNGQIRYAYKGSASPYSGLQSLDFLNYGNGNINYYLQAGPVGLDTGAFHWHNKDTRMMSLTYEGNLGIGFTNPQHRLHVQGISTFTNNVHLNENLEVEGNLTIGGSLDFGSVSSLNVNVGGNLTSADGNEVVVRVPGDGLDSVENGEIRGRLVGGASTITKLDISGNGQSSPFLKVLSNATADAVASDVVIDVNSEAQNKFVVTEQGGVGIGTTNPQNSLDMEYAQRPVVFPNMTSSFRDTLQGLTSGSAIYNTDTNKLQVWNGTTWNDCF